MVDFDDEEDWEDGVDHDWVDDPSVGREDDVWEWNDDDNFWGGEHMEGFGNQEDDDW